MNKRVILAMAVMMAALSGGSAVAAEQTYLSARGGIFLPNGDDGGDYKGFKYFDTGYSVDVAVGYRPVSYAAFEFGTGFYSTSGEVNRSDFNIDRTFYGVPITLTVKGIIETDRLLLSAGAGAGLYQGYMDNKIDFNSGSYVDSVDESNHGTAVGYQIMADADLKLSDRWTIGANFRWFTARPEIEMQNISPERDRIITTKDDWEIGGTTVNIGMKYFF